MDRTQTVLAYLFGVVFAVAGIAMLIYAFGQHSVEASLSANGVHVAGRVVSRDAEWMDPGEAANGNQERYSYTLKVRFATPHGTLLHAFGVTQSAFRQHANGSQVEVVYDPNDPDTALLSGASLNSNPSWQYFLGGTAFTLLGLLMLIVLPIYMRGQKGGAAPTLDEAIRNAER